MPQKVKFIILLALIFLVNELPVHAQTPTVTSTIEISPTVSESVTPTATPTPTPTVAPSAKMVNAVISIGTQYPWNKKIPVTMKVTPQVSGTRLEIKWQQNVGITWERNVGITSATKPKTYIINNPQAGATYTVKFNLVPLAAGNQRAVADIVLTTFNSNYVISKEIPLTLTEKFVIKPTQTNYVLYSIGMYVGLVLVLFIITPFTFYSIFLYIKNKVFPKWLEAKVQGGK